MKSLTAIEKQLEDRCKEEIKEIVSRFIFDVEKLEKQCGLSFNSYTFNTEHSLENIKSHSLQDQLEGILIEEHLSQMVKLKSENLLKKLDLLT
tara:strand:- start:1990 stop:2268 length:279 start_codon:yes stop_codon:yes gene_type:complete